MVGPLGLLMMVTTQNLMASLVHVALSICPLLEQRPHMNDIETGLLRALCNRDTEICVSKGAPFPFILGTLLLTLSQSCDTLVEHVTPLFGWNGVLGICSASHTQL